MSLVLTARNIIWPAVSPSILALHAEIQDYDTSVTILNGFRSPECRPSFFTLVTPLIDDFETHFTCARLSFFFNAERGICTTSNQVIGLASPRLVWAAISAIQKVLANELNIIVAKPQNKWSLSDAARISSLLDDMTRRLVR
jgi:hypothetical protein